MNKNNCSKIFKNIFVLYKINMTDIQCCLYDIILDNIELVTKRDVYCIDLKAIILHPQKNISRTQSYQNQVNINNLTIF